MSWNWNITGRHFTAWTSAGAGTSVDLVWPDDAPFTPDATQVLAVQGVSMRMAMAAPLGNRRPSVHWRDSSAKEIMRWFGATALAATQLRTTVFGQGQFFQSLGGDVLRDGWLPGVVMLQGPDTMTFAIDNAQQGDVLDEVRIWGEILDE